MTLKAEQWVAIEWLAQVKNGGKSLEEIAQLCGVSRVQLWKWRRDDEFQRELKREIMRYSVNRLPEVIEAMVESAITLKSAAAAKIILQANEMLVDQVRIEEKNRNEAFDVDALQERIASYKKRMQADDDVKLPH